MINIALFGPPGSGKGTQSVHLLEAYHLSHISPGDIFREEVKKRSTLGVKIATYIDQGNLVPEELTINLIGKKMEQASKIRGLLLDGYPRSIIQAHALDEQLKQLGITLHTVFFLDVDHEEIRQRIAERKKKMYRADDQNEEVLLHRMDVYRETTLPVAQYYKEQKKLVKINGVGTIKEVTSRIDEVLSPFISTQSVEKS